MRHRFHAEQWLPFPVGTVFAFFAVPMNLPPLMPRWQEARVEEAIVRPPAPAPEGAAKNIVAAGAETKMIVSFRPFPRSPIRLNWHARITEFVWNDHFCDVQEAGPFAYWRHCHRVATETRDGVAGTLLQDDVEYAFRGGPLGDLANALMGREALAKTFRYREEQTIRLLPIFAARLRF